VLVSSHDIEEVERLCDRVAMLEGGRLRLQETAEALQARFRRVEVAAVEAEGAAAGATGRSEWLEWETAGTMVRFVETRYAGGETERAWRARFGAAEVKARPMTLREIFMTLARAERAARRAEVSA
jgi:ABC-2 type transport system ATP-binding protein